jgi:hypothetical protein
MLDLLALIYKDLQTQSAKLIYSTSPSRFTILCHIGDDKES